MGAKPTIFKCVCSQTANGMYGGDGKWFIWDGEDLNTRVCKEFNGIFGWEQPKSNQLRPCEGAVDLSSRNLSDEVCLGSIKAPNTWDKLKITSPLAKLPDGTFEVEGTVYNGVRESCCSGDQWRASCRPKPKDKQWQVHCPDCAMEATRAQRSKMGEEVEEN